VKRVYLDTNVVLKLFPKDEAGKEQAEKIALLAKQNKITLCISQWVINECVAAVDRKKKEGGITDRQASEILTDIADMIEGHIEKMNVSLYPITEEVILDSRTMIMEAHCNSSDALHLYVSDKSDCDYFVTADIQLALSIKNSKLGYRLKTVNIWEEADMKRFLSSF
jgi:predicted nucleic acid-binding protein